MNAMPLHEIVAWLDSFLDPGRMKDYCPNGLQVDADRPVHRIATGVTANLAFIDAAIAQGADLAVVHHGLYWHGADTTITGTLGRRVRRALSAGLSIAAWHLPLDGHAEVGNAPQLARQLGLLRPEPAFMSHDAPVGCIAHTDEPLEHAAFETALREIFPDAKLFRGSPPAISRVGIVTGGAPRMASEAARLGCDAFITGEASEYTQAMAAEEGIHIAACGHHRTEVFGPRALAERLARAFVDLDVAFIDVDNPA
jgi:dinuclear metal center YbgI/SA1388 family protein